MGSQTPGPAELGLEPFDRSGYTVVQQGGGDVAVTWQVTRDADGAGLGAYASEQAIDATIATDRNSRATD